MGKPPTASPGAATTAAASASSAASPASFRCSAVDPPTRRG